METNTRSFRLQDPLDAINFSTFLLRIRNERREKLEKEFEKVRETFLKKAVASNFNWTRTHQLKEMMECGDADIERYATKRMARDKDEAKENEENDTEEVEQD
ncbi:hypothetical protein ABKN59_006062 [Abortiporus biennis]